LAEGLLDVSFTYSYASTLCRAMFSHNTSLSRIEQKMNVRIKHLIPIHDVKNQRLHVNPVV
jgi:hypothetical protein